ncbi:MAG: hypothetical protein LBC59_07590 [Chitinispirillales bacterium]|jgi:hypothetical protein|nr:hypothetical protein [Chitinispirillales bacterium]
MLKAVLLSCVLLALPIWGQSAEEAVHDDAQPAQPLKAEVSDEELVAEPEQAVMAPDLEGEEPEAAAPVHQRAAAESVGSGAGQQKVRLGVLMLESATGHDKEAFDMTALMLERLEELGLYDIYRPADIDNALAGTRLGNGSCRDPRCVIGIGKALGVRRMISGTLDITGSRCAVRLVLLNVISGKPIASVSLEGALGVPAKEVLLAAIDRIHGDNRELDRVGAYFGPPVDNLSEFLWTSVSVFGAGTFYTMVNYGAGGNRGDDVETIGGAYGSGEKLSGIWASANQIPVFARPAALANAYTAVSDDAYGVLYNPAGMPWVSGREAVAAYQYRPGLDIMAVSYVNKALRDLGFGQAILLTTDRDGAMTEVYFVTAAGYKINQDYLLGPFALGAAVKIAGSTVNKLSLDSPYGQSYGFGLDLGLMWELSSNIRYGLLFRDVPTINKWKNRATGVRYTEANPPTLHMGGSYSAGYNAFLTADGQIPLYADQPWVMAGGVEYEFFRMLALRVGLQREILDDNSDWWKITCGAGFKFDTGAKWGKETVLDVSYEYNTLELFHVVNVSVKVEF